MTSGSSKQLEVEQRNLGVIKAWAEAWRLPGGSAARMVDEIYADEPDVVAVLQGHRVSGEGNFKQAWRKAELQIEGVYAERKIVFGTVIASGNSVAFEGEVRMTTKEGESRGWPFSAFMVFNEEGRIVSDHTYMPDSPHGQLFEDAARC
ncbi:nuclear transport factor 2 family protein [Parahaliea aestuarii]|nr:nuclear transport factor 2 family protein [Parahaliea aestuarii]